MKMFKDKPYRNIIEFIDAAAGSDELMSWLRNLETLPDNLRSDHLARMKTKMTSNKEPEKIIDIVESINKPKVLSAINLVIKDVYDSGMKADKYLKRNSNKNFNILISLMTGC